MSQSKNLGAANRVTNRVVTISHSLNKDNVPICLNVDVRVVFADGSSKEVNQLFDYSVVPMDVAMNIACEIVRGWHSENPKR